MLVVLLAWLSLWVQLAHSELPFVKTLTREKNCKEQEWPDHKLAENWEDGQAYNHQKFEDFKKEGKTKIADFFLILEGKEGKEAAIFCDINVGDATIQAFWLTRSGDEATESFVFSYGDKIHDKLRIGTRGKRQGKTVLHTRVEIFGDKEPTTIDASEIVKCGTGNEGKDCPVGLKMEPRLRLD